MYSRAALDTYQELLKLASDVTAPELEKLSVSFNPMQWVRNARSASAAATAAEAAAAAARRSTNGIRRAAQSGMTAAERSSAAAHLAAGRGMDPKRVAMLVDSGHASGQEAFKKMSPEMQSKVTARLQERFKMRGGQPNVTSRYTPPAAPAAPGAPTAPGAPPAAPAGQPMGMGTKAMLGAGALATGAGAYGAGKYVQGQRDKTQRNLAFGAGAATGLAAPRLLQGAAGQLNSLAMNPFGGGY